MGAVIPKYFRETIELLPYFQQVKTERLIHSLTQIKGLFHSELIAITIEGLVLGYYLANVFLICKDNLNKVKQISSSCPCCQKASFQVICKRAGKIVSCGDCYGHMKHCPQCYQQVDELHSVVRLYLA